MITLYYNGTKSDYITMEFQTKLNSKILKHIKYWTKYNDMVSGKLRTNTLETDDLSPDGSWTEANDMVSATFFAPNDKAKFLVYNETEIVSNNEIEDVLFVDTFFPEVIRRETLHGL